MKKYWKLMFLVVVVVMTLFIYKITYNHGYHYVALGDSLAVGVNSYGEINYGYNDYVKDYLEEKELLKSYTNAFSNIDYDINDLKDDIENNRRRVINNTDVSIRKALREADVVTISIGINDLAQVFKNNLNNKEKCLDKIDDIYFELKDLLVEVRKYAKKEILLIGYYNPFPYLKDYNNDINQLIEYSNSNLIRLAEEYNIYYVDIFDDLSGNTLYFSNPNRIYPNSFGYKMISKRLIDVIEANIIN